MRPSSIVRFEQLYIGAFIVGLVNTAMSWSERGAMLAANAQTAAIAAWVLPLTVVIGIAVTALLWYFTARSPSVVAKWIVVVFTAIGALTAIGVLLALVGGRAPVLASVLSLVQTALSIAAAVMLFKPDAKLWFGEMPQDDRADA